MSDAHDPRCRETESARLAALDRYGLLDGSSDQAFDRLTAEAARELDAPVAFISLVDRDRVWLKSRIGVEADHIARGDDACVTTLLPEELYAVSDTAGGRASRTFARSPETAAMRAFAVAPLKTWDGHVLGSLCVLDHGPRVFGRVERERLRQLAAAVMHRLEMRRSLRRLFEVEDALTRARRSERTPEDHDRLTGIAGRRMLLGRLERAVARARRTGASTGALLLLDLDRFKVLNATLGHRAGDLVLCEVAQRVERLIGSGDLAARLGGDELAVLLDGLADDEAARAVAAAVLRVIAEPIRLADGEVTTSACAGVVRLAPGYGAGDEVLRDAETAMYRAKDRGPGEVVLYSVLEHGFAGARLQLLRDLRQAVARGQLRLRYQPIVSLRDGALHAVEALLRWSYPGRGLLLPRDFLPLAEAEGLMPDIGDWVLARACRDLRAWRDRFGATAPAFVTVNLTASQLVDTGLDLRIHERLASSELVPEDLVLEVDEAVIAGHRPAADAAAALGRHGLRLWIDDLGPGFAPLAELHGLAAEAIKIDRALVAEMLAGVRQQSVIETVITRAHELGMSVVAEGVETARQLATLLELGCDHVQGHYLLAAAEDRDLTRLLHRGASFREQIPLQ